MNAIRLVICVVLSFVAFSASAELKLEELTAKQRMPPTYVSPEECQGRHAIILGARSLKEAFEAKEAGNDTYYENLKERVARAKKHPFARLCPHLWPLVLEDE